MRRRGGICHSVSPSFMWFAGFPVSASLLTCISQGSRHRRGALWIFYPKGWVNSLVLTWKRNFKLKWNTHRRIHKVQNQNNSSTSLSVKKVKFVSTIIPSYDSISFWLILPIYPLKKNLADSFKNLLLLLIEYVFEEVQRMTFFLRDRKRSVGANQWQVSSQKEGSVMSFGEGESGSKRLWPCPLGQTDLKWQSCDSNPSIFFLFNFLFYWRIAD